ncbi:serine/threonine-protein kinase [Amphibiibacter pelophylacis]|uniref:Serine/threonine-protein kinase n=1 Tax=Amphibiibacter pelophylacis TaxID=1799477 RepID=A0ACC6NY01_9BURK
MTTLAWVLLGLALGAAWALFQRGRRPPEAASLSAPETGPEADSGEAATDASAGAASPPVLLGLTLQDVLGRGSSATVYRALDHASGDTVAVKVFATALDGQGRARLEDSGDLPRFLQEVQTLERLQHPHIVRARRSGQRGGRVHLVMDLLRGQSLRAWCGSQRLSSPALAGIADQILDALAYAHEQGIVHRDLKPDNILYDEASSQVTLTDFGVARWLQDSQTRSGMMLGSPAYMAPEQLMGQPCDARGDLYALGVVLTELLTGRPAFDAPSLGELMRLILKGPVPAVPDRADGSAPAWNTFLQPLCATDPQQRPASARAARALLARSGLRA